MLYTQFTIFIYIYIYGEREKAPILSTVYKQKHFSQGKKKRKKKSQNSEVLRT